MMAERGLAVDHSTVWRWVQHYAPMLNRRLRRELRHPNRSCVYIFRMVHRLTWKCCSFSAADLVG